MKWKLSIIVMALAATGIQAEQSGEALFKAKCSMCHMPYRPADISKMVAPPAMGITMHVKMAHSDREGFKAFIKDYVINPSKEKALCAKHTVERFKVMPSQKGNVTPEELDRIADYLYDNFAKKGGMGCKGMRGAGHGMQRGMGMHGMQ